MNPDRMIAVRTDKTVYRDGDRCLKVFGAGYTRSEVLSEALNQSRMEEIGIGVPKVLEVVQIEGKWAIVSEYIPGKTMLAMMEEQPEKAEEYLRELVRIQWEILQKSCPDLSAMKDKLNKKICQTDYFATTRFDLHRKIDDMPVENRVCHGDLNPSNLMITSQGTVYVLDWSHATRGYAGADAALSYEWFCLNGKTELAQKYAKLFSAHTGIEWAEVEKWIPITAAAQAAFCSEDRRKSFDAWVGAQRI